MTATKDNFSKWLRSKLQALEVDEGVFLSYIESILEGDDTSQEKLEALESILEDGKDKNVTYHCKEILEKWELNIKKQDNKPDVSASINNVDEKLSKLLEMNVKLEEPSIVSQSQEYTSEQLKIRQAILSQYSQHEADDDEFCNDKTDKAVDMTGLEKNVNAFTIHQAEKEKREKAKIESQKKKEKDKEERDKNKQNIQEKKEARRKKAQKVEQRR